jgi:hypothetical protein
MFSTKSTRIALGIGGLILAALPARDAAAGRSHGGGGGGFHHGGGGGFHHGGGGFHHGGFHHGGFHHGGFHHGGTRVFLGFGFGFGFPGCCFGWPYYAGYPAYAYDYAPAVYAPPTYVSPSTAYAPAPVASAPASGAEECREFQNRVTIGGRAETAYGVACRQPDGTWRIAPR